MNCLNSYIMKRLSTCKDPLTLKLINFTLTMTIDRYTYNLNNTIGIYKNKDYQNFYNGVYG